jgi:hypothetical protein
MSKIADDTVYGFMELIREVLMTLETRPFSSDLYKLVRNQMSKRDYDDILFKMQKADMIRLGDDEKVFHISYADPNVASIGNYKSSLIRDAKKRGFLPYLEGTRGIMKSLSQFGYSDDSQEIQVLDTLATYLFDGNTPKIAAVMQIANSLDAKHPDLARNIRTVVHGVVEVSRNPLAYFT